ncbi:hypothetical protein ATANTOWER_028098, partial [Ataeniobius toweri]|nr:hypothetical protein [Ataeniobius toweri]
HSYDFIPHFKKHATDLKRHHWFDCRKAAAAHLSLIISACWLYKRSHRAAPASPHNSSKRSFYLASNVS